MLQLQDTEERKYMSKIKEAFSRGSVNGILDRYIRTLELAQYLLKQLDTYQRLWLTV